MASEQLVLATARYFERELIVASGLAPVQTSVGAPRFRLGYELAAAVGMLAPYGLLKTEEWAAFERLYLQRLDRYGPEKILRLLEAIAHGADAAGVLLLCFENLAEKPCHRRVFAGWWEDKTGQPVPELRP